VDDINDTTTSNDIDHRSSKRTKIDTSDDNGKDVVDENEDEVTRDGAGKTKTTRRRKRN
jgi:hypothetical protein